MRCAILVQMFSIIMRNALHEWCCYAMGHKSCKVFQMLLGCAELCIWQADTRSVKPFSKRAYEHGVVIVKCPGCQSHHLLSDRLGWYGEKQDIEDILRERGEGACSQASWCAFITSTMVMCCFIWGACSYETHEVCPICRSYPAWP